MITKVHVQILITSKNLNIKESVLLRKIIKMHAGKAGNILKIPLVNITVYPNKNFVIPETGDGGYTPSKDWFHIYIDPQRKDFNKIVKNVIPATIYHEMNHAARWKYTGYGTNLLEVIITEGLATVFAEEQWIKFKAPWADCSEAEINTLLNIVRKREKKNDITYSHGEWFYGTGKLPRWIGYKVGSYVIKSYRSKNKSIKWNQLIKMNANDIIRLSRINLK